MPDVTDVPDYIGSAMGSTNRILSAPLVGNVDTVHLFLSVGVVMLGVLIWTRILAHIKS